MLQNATSLRKSAPWPPNISDEHVFCTAPATRNASLQILFKCPTPAFVFRNATKPSRFAHFWEGAQSVAPATRNTSERPKVVRTHVFLTCWLRNVLRATTLCTFSTSQLPKVVMSWCVLYILTSTCASRHNRVHFFVHFDFESFAPQRRALFRHRNFQKWSDAEVFCTFWLGNVLRATTACNFSSLIWPDGSAPAALANLLFDPPETQIIGKTQCFATFLPFLRICIFFLLTLSRLWSSLFYSSLLSDSSHLCFSSVHIAGSLTSKLPLISVLISLQVNSLHDSSICWTCPYSFSMLW